jgi:CubicO group peptidase (beta-lactamase class C family)
MTPLGPMYPAANVASGILPYDGTIEDSVKRVAALPLLVNPGDRWGYSLGVDVLGRLVEVVSGKTLDEFFRTELIFMAQLHPTGDLTLDRQVNALSYQAIID